MSVKDYKAYGQRFLWPLSWEGSYRAIPVMSRDLDLHILIRSTATFSRLLRRATGRIYSNLEPNLTKNWDAVHLYA